MTKPSTAKRKPRRPKAMTYDQLAAMAAEYDAASVSRADKPLATSWGIRDDALKIVADSYHTPYDLGPFTDPDEPIPYRVTSPDEPIPYRLALDTDAAAAKAVQLVSDEQVEADRSFLRAVSESYVRPYDHGESTGQERPNAEPRPDPVNHPTHYTSSPARCECGRQIECIDVTRHLNFNRGNAVKYLWRAGSKSDELEDLRKARWYLDDEIRRLERE